MHTPQAPRGGVALAVHARALPARLRRAGAVVPAVSGEPAEQRAALALGQQAVHHHDAAVVGHQLAAARVDHEACGRGRLRPRWRGLFSSWPLQCYASADVWRSLAIPVSRAEPADVLKRAWCAQELSVRHVCDDVRAGQPHVAMSRSETAPPARPALQRHTAARAAEAPRSIPDPARAAQSAFREHAHVLRGSASRRTGVEREVERDARAARHARGGADRVRQRLPQLVHALVLGAHRARHVGEAPGAMVRLRGRQHGRQARVCQPRLPRAGRREGSPSAPGPITNAAYPGVDGRVPAPPRL